MALSPLLPPRVSAPPGWEAGETAARAVATNHASPRQIHVAVQDQCVLHTIDNKHTCPWASAWSTGGKEAYEGALYETCSNSAPSALMRA